MMMYVSKSAFTIEGMAVCFPDKLRKLFEITNKLLLKEVNEVFKKM